MVTPGTSFTRWLRNRGAPWDQELLQLSNSCCYCLGRSYLYLYPAYTFTLQGQIDLVATYNVAGHEGL